MPAGVYRTLSCAFYGYTEVCYIHIGVGFNVAYPFTMGNARLRCADSDRRNPRPLFVCMLVL